MDALFEAYLAGRDEVRALYGAAPLDLFAHPPRMHEWPESLADEMRAYQATIGATAAIPRESAVIVTGQQPGLFTGPLYTIHKAATAVLLARRIESQFGVQCTPVFWLASDDHDFEEARTTHLLTKTHEALALRYEPNGYLEGMALHRVPIEASLHALVDRAAGEAPGSELREAIADFLHGTIEASESFAEWNARMLARLFAGTPLVIFSPHLPAARALAAEVLAHEIEHPLLSTRLVNAAARQLEEMGYAPRIVKRDTECGFFLEEDGLRRKVVFEEGAYILPDTGARFSVEAMRHELDVAPHRFSANVALRCAVQQRLFKAVAYVAGPGEVAYWAQMRALIEHCGQDVPVVYPRARVALTTAKLTKLMHKLALTLADLAEGEEVLTDRVLRATGGVTALAGLEARAKEIDAALDLCEAELSGASAGAAAMAHALRARTAADMERIARTLVQEARGRDDTIEKQVRRVCLALMPWRRPQERVYTVMSFLFEHGWDLLPRIMKAIDITSFGLNEVEL